MIWVKTDAGRVEMQARTLVKDRARRNLLLLIDGVKSEEMLLANLAGITADDFQELRKLDLIAPASGAVTVGHPSRPAPFDATRTVPLDAPRSTTPSPPAAAPAPRPPSPPATTEGAAPLDYAHFTAALTRLISAHLGLRGFTLTLAVEKAGTIEELHDVAHRAIAQIRERRGEAVAAEARKMLYGG